MQLFRIGDLLNPEYRVEQVIRSPASAKQVSADIKNPLVSDARSRYCAGEDEQGFEFLVSLQGPAVSQNIALPGPANAPGTEHITKGQGIAKILFIDLFPRARDGPDELFDYFSRRIQNIYFSGEKIPGIVPLMSYFTASLPTGELAYCIVTEKIDGKSLDEILKEKQLIGEQAFPEKLVVSWAISICNTLMKYDFDPDMVHMNLNPCSMLLNSKGNVLLTDFGIAEQIPKDLARNLLMTQKTMGEYAPPEQANIAGISGQQISRQSKSYDQYSLGATIYKLVTGEDPKSLFERISMPKQRFPEHKLISKGLSNILRKLLEISPGRRYRKLSDVFYALDEIQGYRSLKSSIAPIAPIAPAAGIAGVVLAQDSAQYPTDAIGVVTTSEPEKADDDPKRIVQQASALSPISLIKSLELVFEKKLSSESTGVSFSPDGHYLMCSSSDGYLSLFEVDQKLQTLDELIAEKYYGKLSNAAFNCDGSTIGFVSKKGMAYAAVVNFQDKSFSKPVNIARSSESFLCCKFSIDGKYFLIGTSQSNTQGIINVYKFNESPFDASVVSSQNLKQPNSPCSMAFSNDGRYLAIGTDCGNVLIAEFSSQRHSFGEIIRVNDTPWRVGLGPLINGVSFSPDSKILAAGDTSGRLKIYSIDYARKKMQKMLQYRPGSGILDACFNPDGTLLATGHSDGYVKLFRVEYAQK